RRMPAHPRRLRLLQGVRDRAPVPRRAAAADRRGHLRDPAHGHRAKAPGAPQDLGRERSPSRIRPPMTEDAKTLIETATRHFLEEVPALEPIKLIVGIELRGRGDTQHYRLEMP